MIHISATFAIFYLTYFTKFTEAHVFACDLCYTSLDGVPRNNPEEDHTSGRSAQFSCGNQTLSMQGYQGSSFRLTNTNGSIKIDFPEAQKPNAHTVRFSFPKSDKLRVDDNYIFSAVHIVISDSESASPLEIHWLHYSKYFNSIGDAIKSNRSGALAVIGAMLDVSFMSTVVNTTASNSKFQSTISSIVKNAECMKPGQTKLVAIALDLMHLTDPAVETATYKGTGCNSLVNWYIMNEFVLIPKEYVFKLKYTIDPASRGKHSSDNGNGSGSNSRKYEHLDNELNCTSSS